VTYQTLKVPSNNVFSGYNVAVSQQQEGAGLDAGFSAFHQYVGIALHFIDFFSDLRFFIDAMVLPAGIHEDQC